MTRTYLVLLAAGAIAGTAYGQSADNSKSNAAAENSSNSASIADGQSNAPQDLKVTQNIRRSILADKSLSMNAHNVKIVTVNGHVTLNGVVRSDAEKATIEAKAVGVAGNDNVVDDLKVAPQN